MSEEEKKAIELLKNKNTEYYYRFIDVRDAVSTLLNLIDKQQKEIEEKTTIIMAGAEKVKQLEKGNRSLMESRIKWKNRYYKEKAKNKEFISKDKIKNKIEQLKEIADEDNLDAFIKIDAYEELLEESENDIQEKEK